MSYGTPSPFDVPHSGYVQQKPRGVSCATIALVFYGGGALLIVVLCAGAAITLSNPPKASTEANQPFTIDEVPIPEFPERISATEIAPRVWKREISLGDTGGFYPAPGHGGKLVLYVPLGRLRPKSVPCVLITGAGSNLLSGMSLGDGDSPEHIPYVKEGYFVVAYELDGPLDDAGDVQQMKRAFDAFAASRAGMVNARNALQYVLDKVPEVNPTQIYVAGHSSAATHALLFAEHEPRLAGVIAYAPTVNVPKRLGPLLRIYSLQMPSVVDFATQSSPHTHIGRLKCPTFLFHAEDDSNCPIGDTRKFAEDLTQQGTDVTFVSVPTGDHYDSMIKDGIPAAVKWLETRTHQK
jgi:dienelactone hydrolase